MRNDVPNSVPNYTQACIVMFGVNILWILVAIWVNWGFVTAIIFSLWVNHIMTRLALRAQARMERERTAPQAKLHS